MARYGITPTARSSRLREIENMFGILNPAPRNPAIGREFGAFVRELPTHRWRGYGYLSRVLFIVFYHLSFLLLAYYMTSGVFASTKGVPMTLHPHRLTPTQLEQVQQGRRLEDGGRVVIDPERDRRD